MKFTAQIHRGISSSIWHVFYNITTENDKSNLSIDCLEHYSISSLAKHLLLQVPINDQLRRVTRIIVASFGSHCLSDLSPKSVSFPQSVQAAASIGDAQLESLLSCEEKLRTMENSDQFEEGSFKLAID